MVLREREFGIRFGIGQLLLALSPSARSFCSQIPDDGEYAGMNCNWKSEMSINAGTSQYSLGPKFILTHDPVCTTSLLNQ